MNTGCRTSMVVWAQKKKINMIFFMFDCPNIVATPSSIWSFYWSGYYCGMVSENIWGVEIFSGILALISLIIIFFSGERGSFLIRFVSGLLSIFSWKPKLKTLLFALGSLVFFGITTFHFTKDLNQEN